MSVTYTLQQAPQQHVSYYYARAIITPDVSEPNSDIAGAIALTLKAFGENHLCPCIETVIIRQGWQSKTGFPVALPFSRSDMFSFPNGAPIVLYRVELEDEGIAFVWLDQDNTAHAAIDRLETNYTDETLKGAIVWFNQYVFEARI